MVCRRWGWIAGVLVASGSICGASDVLVQDFDGWKITIRPGISSAPAAPRPLAPQAATQPSRETSNSPRIELMTLRQDVAAPPAPPAPAAEPDSLPAILPGESALCDPQPQVMPPEGEVDPRYLSQMYLEIYKSIPFIRAEYEANPSYLHDTTVEFLFGKMRPTVIHRGTTHVVQHSVGAGVPWAYGGPGYDYPRLQLVVPGVGLRIHRE